MESFDECCDGDGVRDRDRERPSDLVSDSEYSEIWSWIRGPVSCVAFGVSLSSSVLSMSESSKGGNTGVGVDELV